MRVKLRLVLEDRDAARLLAGDATLVKFHDVDFGLGNPEWIAVQPGPDGYRVCDTTRPFPTMMSCVRWYLRRMNIHINKHRRPNVA
jgi:hypothetical protein